MEVSVHSIERVSKNSCLRLIPNDIKAHLKNLVKLSWPIALFYNMTFFIKIISVQFAGYEGESSLTAVGLAISFGNAFGTTVINGNNFALQTLCSQSYGAGNLVRFGILTQRGILATVLLSMPVMSLWINAEQILIAMGQDADIAR